jgi:hypothetical protein
MPSSLKATHKSNDRIQSSSRKFDPMSAFSTWLAWRSLNGGWPAEAEQFQGQAVAADFCAGTRPE